MGNGVIYHTEESAIPITYINRANAPEIGDVFTAMAIMKNGKRDLVIDAISCHTGYIKKNFDKDVSVVSGNYYRFKIVSGPHQKNYHNFFYAIPLRRIGKGESIGLNRIDGQNSLLVQRLAEFMLGIGWNRRKKENYKLSTSQWNWNWFRENLM